MTTDAKPHKALHIILWILQVLLAAMFLMAGFMKLTAPVDKLSEMMPWVNDFSETAVRLIGLSELLGGIGLVLPALLRIQPGLTPLAALGIALIMVLAAVYHISKGETKVIGINVVIAAVALFIAWGRYGRAAIRPKKS